jgi:hypothetical protein
MERRATTFDDDSASSDDGPERLPLPHIVGRPAGELVGAPGLPQWVGWVDVNGKLRVDCDNYPAAWLEARLPDDVVRAWTAWRAIPDRVQREVEAHAAMVVHAQAALAAQQAQQAQEEPTANAEEPTANAEEPTANAEVSRPAR